MLHELSLFRILLKENHPPPNKTPLMLVGRKNICQTMPQLKLGKAALSPLALALTPFLSSGFFVAGSYARHCSSPTLLCRRFRRSGFIAWFSLVSAPKAVFELYSCNAQKGERALYSQHVNGFLHYQSVALSQVLFCLPPTTHPLRQKTISAGFFPAPQSQTCPSFTPSFCNML